MKLFDELRGVISENEFAIPIWEVIVFVIIISVCLLLGRNRLGLLTSYCFVFYWGFIANMTTFANILGNTSWGMPFYVFAGFLMFIVAVTSFFVEKTD